jgi:hypothetical protein
MPERVPPYWLPGEKPPYAFCESVTGIGRWHIRKLSAAGLKLGGGIDTPTLCGRIRPMGDEGGGRRGGGGWDLEARITKLQLEAVCPDCRKEYEREVPQ